MPLTVDDLIEKARDQRSRKRYEESLVAALAAVEDEPDNSEAWWQVSLSRIAMGDRRNAIAALRKTVELEPEANNAWTRLGELLLEEGEQDDAKDALCEALSWNEEDLDALEGMSQIYASENDSDQDDEESSVLERIERLSYLDSRQLNRFGNLHYRHGRYHEAIKYWRADVASSDSSASRFNIGLADVEVVHDDAAGLRRVGVGGEATDRRGGGGRAATGQGRRGHEVARGCGKSLSVVLTSRLHGPDRRAGRGREKTERNRAAGHAGRRTDAGLAGGRTHFARQARTPGLSRNNVLGPVFWLAVVLPHPPSRAGAQWHVDGVVWLTAAGAAPEWSEGLPPTSPDFPFGRFREGGSGTRRNRDAEVKTKSAARQAGCHLRACRSPLSPGRRQAKAG